MKVIFQLGVILFSLFSSQINSQDTIHLSLFETLELAIEQSIDLKIAQSNSAEQEAAFQNAAYGFQPQLFFNAVTPNLNRSIEPRALPDGSDAFVSRSSMFNSIGFDLSYQLEKTGGHLSLSSNIERLDLFKTDQFEAQQTYFVNPLSVTYTHPLFSFNDRRWQKERLSLLYTEFKERYARNREDIIIEAITLFKNSFLNHQRVELAARKIIETDSILTIKTQLFKLGKSTRAEILRLNLDQKNNIQEEHAELIAGRHAQIALADFIGLNRDLVIVLEEPSSFEQTYIPLSAATRYAVENKFVTSSQNRRIVEAQKELERTEKNKDIDIVLQASLGLNNTSDNLSNLFHPLLDRELFSATVRMPLTGWKKYRIRQKVAEEQIKQELLLQEKERIDLNREVQRLVTDFDFLKQSLSHREENKVIAQEILDITSAQFLLGTATYTDMIVAAEGREVAIIDYYNTLLEIIQQYYEIRRLCMYDFVNGKALSED